MQGAWGDDQAWIVISVLDTSSHASHHRKQNTETRETLKTNNPIGGDMEVLPWCQPSTCSQWLSAHSSIFVIVCETT